LPSSATDMTGVCPAPAPSRVSVAGLTLPALSLSVAVMLAHPCVVCRTPSPPATHVLHDFASVSLIQMVETKIGFAELTFHTSD